MMGWTDTHCHTHEQMAETGSDELLRRAREAGVDRFVVIGTDADTSAQALATAASHPDVWATIGLHPHDAVEGVHTIEPLLTGDLSRVVALGECGLDYHYENSPRAEQREAFARQIALAKEHGLPLVVHTRDAWDDTFDVFDTEGVPQSTIIHCFTGGPDEARRCLDRGAMISFSGIITFKNAAEIRDAAVLCPVERILVETDAPFLAPVPHRGQPNEPAHVAVVGAAVAALKGIEPAEFAAITTANALRAFPRMR
ncbi:MAG: TatD family deoxyribonuclease [Actinobacteria bacterium]|nr:TatD family deoxyribonuclease [Actinomycetota bacterium]